MTTTEARRLVTVAEFEAFVAGQDDRRFELINGEIVEKVVTEQHGAIVARIVTEIGIYLKQNPIGRIGVEVSHRPGDDELNERLPDVSVNCNIDQPAVSKGPLRKMSELVVEVKSPNDTYKQMKDKAEYYLSKGARMVWLVYPEKLLVEVLTPTDRQLLTGDELISGGEVLPGFSLAVNDVFAGV